MLEAKVAYEDMRDFLIALAERGETISEITGAAQAMRAYMRPLRAPAGAIDVCGTGGDSRHSLNISTAVAIVVAACDVPVAKHGNRAASSKAGAADTLAAAGIDLKRNYELAEDLLADLGLAFLFAPLYHPALGKLADVRRAIGRRTIFNLIGPLANPAGVRRQLIGVAHPALIERYAAAIARLDYDRVLLVSGEEGLDEISVAGVTQIAWITNGQVKRGHISPEECGLPRYDPSAITGGDAAHNARALHRLLGGEQSAYRDAVLINAAGALMVAEHVTDWRDGVEEAAEAIDKGLAQALFACWSDTCRQKTEDL